MRRGEEAFSEKQVSETAALEARIAELERFCGKLALENEILKKALCLGSDIQGDENRWQNRAMVGGYEIWRRSVP